MLAHNIEKGRKKFVRIALLITREVFHATAFPSSRQEPRWNQRIAALILGGHGRVSSRSNKAGRWVGGFAYSINDAVVPNSAAIVLKHETVHLAGDTNAVGVAVMV